MCDAAIVEKKTIYTREAINKTAPDLPAETPRTIFLMALDINTWKPTNHLKAFHPIRYINFKLFATDITNTVNFSLQL